MTRLKKISGALWLIVAFVASSILLFRTGTTNATVGRGYSEGSLPTGLALSEWQTIEPQPPGWPYEKKLTADDAQSGDSLGEFMALEGDTLVISANWEDFGPGDPRPNAGAVYVFERNLGGINNWGQVAKLTAEDAQSGDHFGSSVSISGNTIVVGALEEDGGAGDPLPSAGAAYVFDRNQGGANNWGQTAKLTADDAQSEDYFGWSVAVRGDTVVVGAIWEDGGIGDPLAESGAAYIFSRDVGGAGNWGQVKKLTSSDAQAEDRLGSSIAIEDDVVVIGALGESGGPGDPTPWAGAAYVYDRNQGGAGNWGEVTKLMASDAQSDDYFGISVDLSNDRIIVGAYEEDGGAGDPEENAGAAYLFERDQGGPGMWGEVIKLTASDPESGSDFGISVAIQDELIIVGAWWKDGGPGLSQAGAAYVFGRNQNGPDAWGQIMKLQSPEEQAGDRFGISVASGSNTLVVGATGEDGGPGEPMPGSGAAYVYWNEIVYVPVVLGQ